MISQHSRARICGKENPAVRETAFLFSSLGNPPPRVSFRRRATTGSKGAQPSTTSGVSIPAHHLPGQRGTPRNGPRELFLVRKSRWRRGRTSSWGRQAASLILELALQCIATETEHFTSPSLMLYLWIYIP